VTQKVENMLSAEKTLPFVVVNIANPFLFDGDDFIVFHDNPLDVRLMSFPPTI